MAYKISRKNPIDLEVRRAVGVQIPFSSTSAFIPTYQTRDAIKVNIINYILTGPRERVLNSHFNSPVGNLLFENMSSSRLQNVKKDLSKQLTLLFPQITIDNLAIDPQPDLNLISIALEYNIQNTNITDQVSINIEG